jgi:Leucine Rich repeat
MSESGLVQRRRGLQVADYLQADTREWCRGFCTALEHGSVNADHAWDLLTAAHNHIQAIVLSVHPTLCNTGLSLAQQLLQLPPCMHAYACRAALSTKPGADCGAALALHAQDAPGAVQLLADALPAVPEAQDLHVADFGRGKDAWIHLVAALAGAPQLRRATVTRGTIPEEALGPLFASLAAASSLRHLTIASCCFGGVSTFAALLPTLPSLQALSLRSNGIHNAGASVLGPSLAALPSLTLLDLSSEQIGNAGIAALSAHLSCVTGLQDLDFSVNNINAVGVEALAPSLAALWRLTHLNLCWCAARMLSPLTCVFISSCWA